MSAKRYSDLEEVVKTLKDRVVKEVQVSMDTEHKSIRLVFDDTTMIDINWSSYAYEATSLSVDATINNESVLYETVNDGNGFDDWS